MRFTAYADKIGVSASDARSATAFVKSRRVCNPITGQFDRDAYDAFLQRAWLSRSSEFENDMRGDHHQREMLMKSLVAGARAPIELRRAWRSHTNTETRVDLHRRSAAVRRGRDPAADRGATADFYEDSQELAARPGIRALTLVYARVRRILPRA